jgi:hypothetical protein
MDNNGNTYFLPIPNSNIRTENAILEWNKKADKIAKL